MAESIMFNFIEKLIVKLSSMAVEACNVRDDVEKLVENMSEIKAVILDAEEQQQGANSHQVQLWLEKLKDTLYDAEDLLDDFSTEHLRRHVMTKDKKAKKVRIFFSSSNQLIFSFKMAHKIKELKKIVEGLNVDGKTFKFTKRTPEPRVVKQRQTHSFIRSEEVIGREKEKKELIESLLNTNVNVKENVSVISIIGIGGLGKTALAQLVYNDKTVQQHFELKMWVCVADDSDVRGFDLKTIAAKILGSKSDDEMDQVQQELRKKVEGKRYLLVLDDTWNEDREDWLQLMRLLEDGAKGSKIIVTTRSEHVARIVGTSSPLFLKGLDEKQSWILFSQLAFDDSKDPENQNLVSMGKEIVKKCAGVPLAIRSIGSLMYSMESEKDWSNFKDTDLLKIDEQRGNKVFQLIKLSYDRLPFHLKKCFAFCSLFPKDDYMERKTLIRLWIAAGLIQPSDGNTSIEDTADKYFMALVHGSFFQDFCDDRFGDKLAYFKMHDLMHDLATFISRNDYVLVNKKGQHISKQTRHVSLGVGFASDSSWKIPSSLFEANKLRTFMSSPPNDCVYRSKSLKESFCNLIISTFKQIRMLKLNGIRKIPSCVGMLKHLRYLDLSNSDEIEVLPRSITKLSNLETLILNWCSKLKELPKDIWRLTSLKHLEIEFCDELTCMPRGIGQLTNLQTLTKFVLDKTSKHSAGSSELRELNDLRGELKITGLQHLRHSPTEAGKEMNLMGKSHLQSLMLQWGDENDCGVSEMEKDEMVLHNLLLQSNIEDLAIYGFCGVDMTFSMSDNSLPNLNRLSILSCKRLQSFPQLHHVKSIRVLTLPCLEWIVNDDNSNCSSSTFSPSLEEMYLFELDNLKGWCRCNEEEVQRGCRHRFKSIDFMFIYGCPNLISIPIHMTSIRRVVINNTRVKILEQAVNHSNVEYLSISNIDDLKSLSGLLQHLTKLVDLGIEDCEDLDPCNDEDDGRYSMQWKELKNLRQLEFNKIPKMEYLPEGLQHVTTLQSLTISDCVNLASIPDWTTSLPTLRITNCPKLPQAGVSPWLIIG